MAFDFLKKKVQNDRSTAQETGQVVRDKAGITRTDVERLAKEASHIIAMFESVYPDKQERLKMVSALAGHACHQAVKANGESFVTIQTKDGLEFYFGDDINYYLLEGPFSVLTFMKGYYENKVAAGKAPDIHESIKNAMSYVGNPLYRIWNQHFPGILYNQVKECWTGIYQNMTARYCKNPSEWPVLYGIVLQNIMFQSDLAPEETFYKALECILFISKMDDKSSKHKDLDDVGNDFLYNFYQNNEPVPMSEDDKRYLRTSIDILRVFLKENKIAHNVQNRGLDTKIFEFKMLIQNEPVTVLVAIFMKPRMCSIMFKLPFVADENKVSEMCMELARYNYSRRFGAFQYDRDDGELSYKTDFPCSEGIKKVDFEAAFIISMNSVSKFIGELKQFAVYPENAKRE